MIEAPLIVSSKRADQRLRVVIHGAVQGVGFRPFVYHLASTLNLHGWVENNAQGVFIEVEGETDRLREFLARLEKEKPAHAFIQSLESAFLDPQGFTTFNIRGSEAQGAKTALILPDIATCPDCLRELFDPNDRRFRYPFLNCTHCGPRYSIIQALPYDRANTTMAGFVMCRACRQEYEDPTNRRFHAQPTACPYCGPHLEFWNAQGAWLAAHETALIMVARALAQGKIVALKGIGGFQLLADARNPAALAHLRERKHREEKPFALMCPTLASARELCEISPLEERLLTSSEAPIVLLRRKPISRSEVISDAVAPGNPNLGIMLPYSPLHHLLMKELGFPVVATSGNVSDEPICTDEYEAISRLFGIADYFLVHDRPIARHVDDSIVRIVLDRELVLRRARGYAPLPITLHEDAPPLLAVGAHLKNTVAITSGKSVFISQHIGDLETLAALSAFERVIDDLKRLYPEPLAAIASDLHPHYASTRVAERSKWPLIQVQHHYAHVLSCMAENEVTAPALGIAWDGTGYGTDKTIWGGEFLKISETGFDRVASFRPFTLPGGEHAIEVPARTAMALLYEMMGDMAFELPHLKPLGAFSNLEKTILKTMLKQHINSPTTTSAGRLFDAVASLIGIRQEVHFEAQAAMELEYATEGFKTEESYPFLMQGPMVDWAPLIKTILRDMDAKLPPGFISVKFHNTLAEIIVSVARRVAEPKVILSGGCFQNRYLTERAVTMLREAGFKPYWHQRVPPNDGGIALGQIVAAVQQLRSPESRVPSLTTWDLRPGTRDGV